MYIDEKRPRKGGAFHVLAEGEGFKPPIPERGIPDFESSAIDHSANLPIIWEPSLKSDAKIIQFSDTTKDFAGNLQKLAER